MGHGVLIGWQESRRFFAPGREDGRTDGRTERRSEGVASCGRGLCVRADADLQGMCMCVYVYDARLLCVCVRVCV